MGDLVAWLRDLTREPPSREGVAEAIERLMRERDVVIRELGKWVGRAGHAEARVDELMAALRPFISGTLEMQMGVTEKAADVPVRCTVTAAQIDAARAALGDI